jgi:hypothetical protein
MKHLFPGIGLCFAFYLSAQDAPPPDDSTDEVSGPRPAYRYLFVVDTSSAMSRQKDITIDTVSKLILSGLGGRIRTGDPWGIWTFDDQLHTDSFPAQTWNSPQRRDVANRVFRFLRDQPLKKKKGHLDEALAAIADEAKISDDLTVFLFTDGTVPARGTPFDDSINDIFTKNATGMRKAKKPFVLVFVAQDGRLAAHGVSPGGEPVLVPRLAKKPGNASGSPAAQVGPGTKSDAPATSPSPPKRSLTVEEISRALREAQSKQTNPVATAPGPLILRGTNSAAPGESDKTNAQITGPAPNGHPPGNDTNVPRSNAVTKTDASAAGNVSASEKTRAGAAPQKTEDVIATVNPPEEKSKEPPEVASSASPQSAVILPPEPASTGGKYLLAAGALLLIALTLAWLYIRGIRYVPRPSLISQSLDKEKK